MNNFRDKFKRLLSKLPFFCPMFHKKSWTWSGHGDYRKQHCSKCNHTWVTLAHKVTGDRTYD